MKPIEFAICIANDGYPASLEVRKVYRVLPADTGEDGFLRVIDESGEDYLFPEALFVRIDLPPAVTDAIEAAA